MLMRSISCHQRVVAAAAGPLLGAFLPPPQHYLSTQQQPAVASAAAATALSVSSFRTSNALASTRLKAVDLSSWGGGQRAYAAADAGGGSSSGGKEPVYLVFGATGGIGSSLVRRLAGSPAAALVLSADQEDNLNSLKSQLSASQAKVDVLAADAVDPDAVERVVQRVMQQHGRLDGVVNCVGSVVAASTLATDLDKLQDALKVNLFSSFNIVKSSVKAMVGTTDRGTGSSSSTSSNDRAAGKSYQNGGSIVLVSAALASHGIPNYEAMSAAKAAVEGLARSAAATYAAHNIRVNCVAPGLTRTPQTKKFTDNANVTEASEQMHPLKELATPDKIASALEFLLRPENDFITGQVLAVDGGLSTLHPHHAEEYGV